MIILSRQQGSAEEDPTRSAGDEDRPLGLQPTERAQGCAEGKDGCTRVATTLFGDLEEMNWLSRCFIMEEHAVNAMEEAAVNAIG